MTVSLMFFELFTILRIKLFTVYCFICVYFPAGLENLGFWKEFLGFRFF